MRQVMWQAGWKKLAIRGGGFRETECSFENCDRFLYDGSVDRSDGL